MFIVMDQHHLSYKFFTRTRYFFFLICVCGHFYSTLSHTNYVNFLIYCLFLYAQIVFFSSSSFLLSFIIIVSTLYLWAHFDRLATSHAIRFSISISISSQFIYPSVFLYVLIVRKAFWYMWQLSLVSKAFMNFYYPYKSREWGVRRTPMHAYILIDFDSLDWRLFVVVAGCWLPFWWFCYWYCCYVCVSSL